MDDYPGKYYPAREGPESVERERKILHGAWEPAPAHGMRQEDEATRAASLSMIPITREKWSLYREIVPEQKFGYMWECPDIFSLDERRILSFLSSGDSPQNRRSSRICTSQVIPCCPRPDLCNEYSSRQNNGTAECAWNPEETFQEWDMGFDFYAPQSFEDEEGRRILIGWAGVPDTEKAHRNLSVENGWQHCLTLPTELVYHSGKIFRRSVRELEELPWKEMYPDAADDVSRKYHWEDQTVEIREGRNRRRRERIPDRTGG